MEIVSTGSTAAHIESAGVPVTRVEELTGFPEILDGRVKTLHPKVHAGLLADMRLDAHRAQLAELGIQPFDLLVSNLYPFQQTVASGASVEECVEQIDIGGPAMVRAAAKNHANVAVVTSPLLYDLVAVGARARRLQRRGAPHRSPPAPSPTSPTTTWPWPQWCAQELRAERAVVARVRRAGLRRSAVAALRREPAPDGGALHRAGGAPGLAQAEQLGGKEMSYNNYIDADAAWRAAHDFERARGRDHQAPEPLRHRDRATTSPRRTARRTPATRCRPSAA